MRLRFFDRPSPEGLLRMKTTAGARPKVILERSEESWEGSRLWRDTRAGLMRRKRAPSLPGYEAWEPPHKKKRPD